MKIYTLISGALYHLNVFNFKFVKILYLANRVCIHNKHLQLY